MIRRDPQPRLAGLTVLAFWLLLSSALDKTYRMPDSVAGFVLRDLAVEKMGAQHRWNERGDIWGWDIESGNRLMAIIRLWLIK